MEGSPFWLPAQAPAGSSPKQPAHLPSRPIKTLTTGKVWRKQETAAEKADRPGWSLTNSRSLSGILPAFHYEPHSSSHRTKAQARLCLETLEKVTLFYCNLTLQGTKDLQGWLPGCFHWFTKTDSNRDKPQKCCAKPPKLKKVQSWSTEVHTKTL